MGRGPFRLAEGVPPCGTVKNIILFMSLAFGAAVRALAMTGLGGSRVPRAALDEGVSANSIKIGYISSVTGPAGSSTGNHRRAVGRMSDPRTTRAASMAGSST